MRRLADKKNRFQDAIRYAPYAIMAIRKTEAIILRTLPFRSTSLIVTLFSKQFGKIRGLAKGVRQEREMRGATFELFSQVEIIYYEKQRSDLHLITETCLLESYEGIRGKIEPIAYSSYFAEVVDQLTEIQDPHPQLFELLDFSFRYVASIPAERLSRIFETKTLFEIGWLPYLDGCIQCGLKNLEGAFFSPAQGGLLCRACAPQVSDAKPISYETLSVLRYYSDHDLADCIKLPLSHQTEQGLAFLMQRFFMFRLHRPLKTRQFIDKIQPAILRS